jgi:thymidylate synthase (FAD)
MTQTDSRTLLRDPSGYPYVPAPVHATAAGTPYLTLPGVHLIARMAVSLEAMRPFLEGFEPGLAFPQYLDDPTPLPDGAQLAKAAGQLCYMSFGPKRSMNADAERYFANLRASGHGSVLEHAAFTFLCCGISRSVTHEIVRHRAGFAYSQVSQRYVSGKVLRFVERPEYVGDAELHSRFLARIDRAAEEYERLSEALLDRQRAGSELLSAEARTDLRKKVQQAARSALPNETEAPIVITANARAWRHFLEMRASAHAETEIRALAVQIYRCLAAIEPTLFADYRLVALPDGTQALRTSTPKV